MSTADSYDASQWEGLSKEQFSAFFRFARYMGAVTRYKGVAKHLWTFNQLGLAHGTGTQAVITPKGKELYVRMCRAELSDCGLT